MTEERLLTAEEVATYLGLNLRTVTNMAQAGTLPAVKIGRAWKFKRADIEAYVEAERKKQSRASSEA